MTDSLAPKFKHIIQSVHVESLEKLLNELPQLNVNINDIIIDGHTLLTFATTHYINGNTQIDYNVEIVRLLIAHGAVVNNTNAKGRTALWEACESYRVLHSYNYDKWIDSDLFPIIKLLIMAGADCNMRPDKSQYTCLMMMAVMHPLRTKKDIKECSKIIKLLIDHGADRNLTDSNGKTAESLARLHNKIQVVDCIRDYKKGDKLDVVKPVVTCDQPADIKPDVAKPDVTNDHPADIKPDVAKPAVTCGQLDELDHEITNFEISQKLKGKLSDLIRSDKSDDLDELLGKLIKKGIDLDAIRTDDKYTMLYLAADKGHIACVRVLIKYQVDTRAICGNECALSQACFQYRTCKKYELKVAYSQIIRLLIANGADCNFKSTLEGFYPPLMRMCDNQTFKTDATEQDRIGIVKLLISNGADRTIVKFCKTAEQLARHNGYLEIADFVRDYRNDQVDEAVLVAPVVPVVPAEPVAPIMPAKQETINIEQDITIANANQHVAIKNELEQDIIIAKLKNELLELNRIGAEKTVAISQWCLQKMDNDIQLEIKRTELAKLRALV